VSNRPAWAQFSSTTGALTGTPTKGSGATDANIVISVSDASKSAALPPFSIAVAPAATSPVVLGAASVSWTQPVQNADGSPLTDLVGYVIRYGTNTGSLNTRISVRSRSSTNAEIANLSPGKWYFEVASVSVLNMESRFSSIIGVTIQ
jgi:hypothetical protein